MLVKEDKPTNKSNLKSNWAFIFILLAVVLLVLLFTSSWSFEKTKDDQNMDQTFSLISENNLEKAFGEFFSEQGEFRGAPQQSSEESHSRKYSIRLGGENSYGLEYRILNPKRRVKYRVSVWTKSVGVFKGVLAISGSNSKALYKQESAITRKDKNGWGQIELNFTTPGMVDLDFVKVYTWAGKSPDPIYFDDIKIEVIEDKLVAADSSFNKIISINLSQKEYNKLERKKNEAYSDGILISADDDWAKATIKDPVINNMKAKVRLKGDWLDHLEGKKWSLRVKLKDPYSWNGLMTFSLQTPASRLFLKEWVFHKILQQEDILAPRYGFLKMNLNNEDRGVYAYEEHFDKQLIEHNKRREGPILKLSEDFLWLKRKREKDLFGKNGVIKGDFNSFKIAEIRAFKENRFADNETLKKNFETAQNLLYGYLNNSLSGDDVFDIELMAKYYALVDLNQAYHGNIWHNQRLYYNPVISKMEPIGYDGFGSAETGLHRGPFMGYYNGIEFDNNLNVQLFKEQNFCRRYNYYLDLYTEVNFIESFALTIENDINVNLDLLQEEFKDYTFDLGYLSQRAKSIQFYLRPEDELSLHVKTGDNKSEVICTNVHYLALDIVGYTYSDKKQIYYLDEPFYLPAIRPREQTSSKNVNIPSHAKRIVFTVAGIKDIEYFSEIFRVAQPNEIIPRINMNVSSSLNSIPFLFIDSTTVTFEQGSHTLQQNLVIPQDKTLVILPGTKIDVVNGAAIIIYSGLQAMGSEDQPIQFTSTDNTAQGISVLQSNERSMLKNVIVDGFNTLNKNGWTLTGAVTFYEADVDMIDCAFINARCEDALNIIRSDIKINGLNISNALSDGFDADFCSGIIDNAKFNTTGNDAMDLSGSDLKIINCTIQGAGDKGISVGENTNVHVLRASIDNSNIGLASKDLSYLEVQNVSLKNCNQGFALYQKKPEFGPARMNIRYHTMNNVKQAYLVERNSELQLGDKLVFGE